MLLEKQLRLQFLTGLKQMDIKMQAILIRHLLGPGLWVPTPPAFAPASTPYWGNNRPIIPGDIHNTQPGPPVTYSKTPGLRFIRWYSGVLGVSSFNT